MKTFIYLFIVCNALFIAASPSSLHGCTTWMVFSDLTGNNTNVLHKNRDSKIRNIAIFLSPANSPRKWIASGNNYYTAMGMNSSGLAAAVNSGEKCVDPPKVKGRKDTTEIVRAILENCDTAAQAVKKLKEFIKAGDYSHGEKGSTFSFLDLNEGFVCETTAKFCSVQRYSKGYTVRANIWQNPDMYQLSRNTLAGHIDSSIRAYIALSGINQMIDKNGKFTVSDNFELSRHCQLPETLQQKRSVCYKNTNSTASMEIDRQYPDVLSSMYVTIGHPRHTIYVPVPVCAEKLHSALNDLKWSSASFKRLTELDYNAAIPAEWTKFEKDSFAEYSAAKNEARKLLNANKRAEAVKLMNSTSAKIQADAAKLMNL